MSVDPAALWSSLRLDVAGLVVAVVQHAQTDQVLMVGYMNRDALAATLKNGRVTFFSRSRQRLWEKGETSGHTLELRELRVDCDADALLVRADPRGPTCHTGKPSCFFRPVAGDDAAALLVDEGPPVGVSAMFARVFQTILDRQAGRGMTHREGRSYVASLLARGIEKIASKITEEADELVEALRSEDDERVASEAADLMFHAMVGLAARGVHLREVAEVFARRFGTSGIDEKAARSNEDGGGG